MPHEYGLTKNQLHSSRTPDGINLSPIRPAIPHAPGQYVIRACTLSSSYYKKDILKDSFDTPSEGNLSQKLFMPGVVSFLF